MFISKVQPFFTADDCKRLLDNSQYACVVRKLAFMVYQRCKKDGYQQGTNIANQLMQSWLPLLESHLKELVKESQTQHGMLADQGAAAHERCTLENHLLSTSLYSHDTFEAERDRIGDEVLSMAKVRFALEACLEKQLQNQDSIALDATTTLLSMRGRK